MLLGLFPVEYWMNATDTSTADQSIYERVLQTNVEGKMHTRLAWKPPTSTLPGTQNAIAAQAIRFDEDELAQTLFQVYLSMFQNEDISSLFSKIDLVTIQNSFYLRYHRGSLASFLCFVKKTVAVTEWNKVMSTLLDLIESD
jgi:hypothetical protein